MKPINIKIMMALIEKEPGDQYVETSAYADTDGT